MASFIVELNSRPAKDGLYSVFVRFTENRKSRKVKLNFRIPKEHFNKQAKYGKWVRMANSKQRSYNKEIEDAIDELKAKYAELKKQELPVLDYISKDELPDASISLRTYFDRHLANVKADSSVGYYRHVKSKLERFVKYFKPETAMGSITTQHIAEYKNYLLMEGIGGTTVNDNMQRVLSVFRAALLDDTITKDPFRAHVRAKVQPKTRTKLTDEQIQAMKDLDLPLTGEMNWMHHTRNYYLFSYYNAGIRVADLMQLRQGNITAGRLEYEMDKTGHKKSILLNKSALAILQEYIKPGSAPEAYLFPILDSKAEYAKFVTYAEKRKMKMELREKLFQQISAKTAIINNNLGFISTKLELPKKISFHTARHSFADKARRAMKTSNKITLVDIMNSLGHKKIETTQGYLNSFDKESLDEAMGSIFD